MRGQGQGAEERGRNRQGKVIVAVDARYYRPTEVETLLGDASRARTELGWKPCRSFEELVREMVEEDRKAAEKDALVKAHGYRVPNYHER